MDDKKRKHLEIMYQEKMMMVAKEVMMNARTKKTYERILSEKESIEYNREQVIKQIDELSIENEQQKTYLELQKTTEFDFKQKY